MRPLGAQCGVVAVAGVNHGVVVVGGEHPGFDVLKQLLETALLPGFAHPAGEAVVTGDPSYNPAFG